jgi:hypothetical protein
MGIACADRAAPFAYARHQFLSDALSDFYMNQGEVLHSGCNKNNYNFELKALAERSQNDQSFQ